MLHDLTVQSYEGDLKEAEKITVVSDRGRKRRGEQGKADQQKLSQLQEKTSVMLPNSRLK